MRIYRCLMVMGLSTALLAGAAWGGQTALNEEDLKRFIEDVPRFLEWSGAETPPTVLKKASGGSGFPFSPRQRELIRQINWDPELFIFIFNRVILAGIIVDMGGCGERQLQNMLEQRNRISADKSMASGEKKQFLADLDQAMAELQKTSSRCNKIPWSELLLLWAYRDDLKRVMWGKVPVKQKTMRRY